MGHAPPQSLGSALPKFIAPKLGQALQQLAG